MCGKPNEQFFTRQVVIQLPVYVTHIIGEPKYKYGQEEQVTVRNHNRSTALEWLVYVYIMFSIDYETFQIKINPNIVLFKPVQTKYQVSIQISYHIEVLRHFGSTITNLYCNATVII